MKSYLNAFIIGLITYVILFGLNAMYNAILVSFGFISSNNLLIFIPSIILHVIFLLFQAIFLVGFQKIMEH